MGLIRESALQQMPDNDNGLITASNARTVFGIVEDCLTDGITDLETIINNIQTGASAVGNIYEVQMKGEDNTLLSSSNFTFNTVNNEFLLSNSSFTVNNSISKFKLPLVAENNFIITSDTNEINNILEINTSSNTVNIGTLNSTVALKRGNSTLDESLVLSEELVNINNANVVIKTANDSTGDAFTLLNSSNQNLLTIGNNGGRSKNVSSTFNNTGEVKYNNQISTITTAGSNVNNIQYNNYNESNISTFDISGSNINYVEDYKKVTLNGSKASNKVIGLGVEVVNNVGAGSALAGYFNNALCVGTDFYQGPTNELNGLIGLRAHGESFGLDINRKPQFGTGVKSLVRMSSGNVTGILEPFSNMLTVGDGIQTSYSLFIDRDINTVDTITTDYHGIRIIDTTQLAPSTEMFFKTTQGGISVEPLSLRGNAVKIAQTTGEVGFYGVAPTTRQDLPPNPTNAELATVLANLGLVNLI